MIKVDGINNESLILEGEWLEKHRAGEPKAKLPASSFRSAERKELDRRKKLFGGEREHLIQLVLSLEQPPFIGFTVVEEKRSELDSLLAALESARA